MGDNNEVVDDYKLNDTDTIPQRFANRFANLLSLKSIITLLFDISYVYMVLSNIQVPNTYEYILYGVNISLFGISAFQHLKIKG